MPDLPFCPNCGHNLQPDTPVEIGPWQLWPTRARLNGQTVDLTRAECGVLHSLATARDRTLSSVVIGQRISYAENVENLVAVLISRIRNKLGNACPIETVRGFGYRWASGSVRLPHGRLDLRLSRNSKLAERWRLAAIALARGVADDDVQAIFELTDADFELLNEQVAA